MSWHSQQNVKSLGFFETGAEPQKEKTLPVKKITQRDNKRND